MGYVRKFELSAGIDGVFVFADLAMMPSPLRGRRCMLPVFGMPYMVIE